MFKIFFATLFIAEVIIALAVISKIYKFNKLVNSLNEAVLASQSKIRMGFFDLRFMFEEFNRGLSELKDLICRKREEYILNILKKSLVYGSFFFLKGKYKKAVLAYQIVREIYEGCTEI